MISANILLKNKTDKHLNVFWQYDGKPWLENNITKAFINTIDSLNEDGKREIFKELFGLVLPQENLSYEYYLQTSPQKDLINRLSDDCKVLFAFSPTGKVWGHTGIDSGNEEEIKRSIRQSLREFYTEKPDEEIGRMAEEELRETLKAIANRGGSIPDAWIIVFQKDEPLCCVAMENKLHDLDPFQLRNHCEKSLRTRESPIVYCKYAYLLETLSNERGYLAEEFLRYMFFLGYWEVNNLSQVEGMDNEDIKRYATERCKQLLHEAGGKDVTWHKNWMYKYDSDNEFCRQVGMHYCSDSKKFEVPLYFGPTQTSAKRLYEHLKEKNYSIDSAFAYKNSFHFQYAGTGKNINCSYYCYDEMRIERYIDFWRNHSDYICQMGPKDRHKVLEEMFNADIIPQAAFKSICAFSDSYGKKLNIVPEIGVFCRWEFAEALERDKEHSFAKDIKEKVEKAQKSFV